MDNHQESPDAIRTTPEPSPLGVQDQVSDLPDKEAVAAFTPPAGNAVSRFFKSHPTGFWFFFWGEFAERCSYYGMRAILALYMADELGLGEANASTYVSFFIAACYFLPLVGGYVADHFFGKYWTIVGFSLPYILGQYLIGIEQPIFVVTALVLLAMGSGVIKPNISTLMGLTYDQQRPGQERLRSDAFAIFYFSINIGAALASLTMPSLRTHYGYRTAFLFPAILMALAFIIFALGKKYYATEVLQRHHTKSPEERAEQWRVLRSIMGLFLLVMFFWAVFDQSTSTWIFFANACMNLHLFGVKVDPDQIQSFNPVFILVLLPLITLFFKYLQNRGITIRPTDKMVAGFLLTAACMGVMAFAAWQAGTADLRAAILEGKSETDHLQLVVGGKKEVVIQGQMKVRVADADTIAVTVKTKAVGEEGKEKVVKTNYVLSGKDVLKLVPVEGGSNSGQADQVRIVGPVTKLVQIVEKDKQESKEVLLEGNLKANVSGNMKISERWFVNPDRQVTVWWQIFAYLIITVAEVLISVTGLELAYTAAPKSMTGFVTACWLVTVGLANLFINAPITRVYTVMQPMAYFAMLAGTLLVVGIAFIFVARRFNRIAAERAAIPVGADDKFTPPTAPSDKITERDRYQNPS